jgi:hypothetical protein
MIGVPPCEAALGSRDPARDAVVFAAVAGLPIIASQAPAEDLGRATPERSPLPLPDPAAWLEGVRPEEFA